MKRILFATLTWLCCSLSIAAPYKHLVFFGDSITDNGNLYKLSLNIIPKSPPYYEGRFSNGPTWADVLAKDLAQRDGATYENYAYGGATAIYHPPTLQFISPSTLELELSQYFMRSMSDDTKQTLYFIWIGGNDYLFDREDDPDDLSTRVVNRIALAIDQLQTAGGRDVVVVNLPDLSRLPFSKQKNIVKQMQIATVMHNQKLLDMVHAKQQQNQDMHISFVDVYGMFKDVLDDTQQFNQKFGTHFSELTTPCWTGWFVMNARSSRMALSPSLAEADRIASLSAWGVKPCSQPETYLFWDQIHPTAEAHQMVARIIEKELSLS